MMNSFNNGDLKEAIINKAKALGFCKIGFSKVEPLTKEFTRLDIWLGKGYQGTMKWLEKDLGKKNDPFNILPNARSIISVAINYYSEKPQSKDKNAGRISKYALGDDYHEVIKDKLTYLIEFIRQKEPTTEGKIYVDAGPIMEKAWAIRSGIGWRGKHSITITKEYGSWIFLGEIICNLDFEIDLPISDMCGDCTLCIDSCPTQAIVEPYVLNASRCISYFTIEHDEDIQPEMKTKIGSWIFGCDICQEVCPWNIKLQQPSDVPEFKPRFFNLSPDLKVIVDMNEEEFKEKFNYNSIKRRKLAGLKRNVKIVLNNLNEGL